MWNKEKKLSYTFKKNYIRVCNISYNDLKAIFDDEFRKFFKILQNDLEIVYERESIKARLESLYKEVRARNLYNFYILIQAQGLQEVKRNARFIAGNNDNDGVINVIKDVVFKERLNDYSI